MTDKPFDPADDGALMDFDRRMSYADYLQLDRLLDAQRPMSTAHDELLFIIQHQTAELWIKLAMHELTAARAMLRLDRLEPCFKMLARVARIFDQLNSSWDVLRTLTPAEYTRFRRHLGQSSGFQSVQYRAIEFLVGNKNPALLRPHAHDGEATAYLESLLAQPSLYDEALLLLARRGFAIDEAVIERDWRLTHQGNDSVLQAWKQVYDDAETSWQLYNLAEKLVDFEDFFRRWRFNHLTTVERIIGSKRGTGGTSGTAYLKRMLDTVLFPELWQVRTLL